MIIIIECILLCVLFTIMVFIMSKEPIKTLYNNPPRIQERVKQLDFYKDKIPTNKNKICKKIFACFLFLLIISFVLRYINGYKTFNDSFSFGYLLWTVVNLYDLIVLDILWFCHDSRFIFKGTEDMEKEYHNYLFHIKGFFIGEVIGLIICILSSFIIAYFL